MDLSLTNPLLRRVRRHEKIATLFHAPAYRETGSWLPARGTGTVLPVENQPPSEEFAWSEGEPVEGPSQLKTSLLQDAAMEEPIRPAPLPARRQVTSAPSAASQPVQPGQNIQRSAAAKPASGSAPEKEVDERDWKRLQAIFQGYESPEPEQPAGDAEPALEPGSPVQAPSAQDAVDGPGSGRGEQISSEKVRAVESSTGTMPVQPAAPQVQRRADGAAEPHNAGEKAFTDPTLPARREAPVAPARPRPEIRESLDFRKGAPPQAAPPLRSAPVDPQAPEDPVVEPSQTMSTPEEVQRALAPSAPMESSPHAAELSSDAGAPEAAVPRREAVFPHPTPEIERLPVQSLPLEAVWSVQRFDAAPPTARDAAVAVETADTDETVTAGEMVEGMTVETDVLAVEPQVIQRMPEVVGARAAAPAPGAGASGANLVPTEVGPLPDDLWALLDEPTPVDFQTGLFHRAPAAADARPVGGGARGQSQAPPVIQREAADAGGTAVTDGTAPAASVEPISAGNSSRPGAEGVDVEKLAQQVYANLRRRLATEWERTRR